MYLGIEIGGTKLQLGLGHGDGKLLALWRGSVDAAAGGEGIRRQIVAAVPELLAKAGVERRDLRGVGVGFGGPTDDETQSVVKSHHIEGWTGFPLADWLLHSLSPELLGGVVDDAYAVIPVNAIDGRSADGLEGGIGDAGAHGVGGHFYAVIEECAALVIDAVKGRVDARAALEGSGGVGDRKVGRVNQE